LDLGTKDQFARDDPAFLLLLALSLSVTSILFALVLSLSFGGFVAFFMWVVFVDCIGVGLVVATSAWYVDNFTYFNFFDQGSSSIVTCEECKIKMLNGAIVLTFT
jgi:hypothetical protein